MPTARPDLSFKGVLPAPPTAVRDFGRDDTLTAMTRLYDYRVRGGSISLTASVLSESATTVFSASEAIAATDVEASNGYAWLSRIPLQQLNPGRYVLRIAATAGSGNTPDAERELVFSVR